MGGACSCGIGTGSEAAAGVALTAAVRAALAASASLTFALVFATFDYPAEEVAATFTPWLPSSDA